MVTVVPGFNRGGSLASALGSGGVSALENPIVQQRYQRRELQEGLDEALQGMTPEMKGRLGSTVGLLKAFAGIPGNERAQAALLPEVLRQQYTEEAKKLAPPGQGQGARIREEMAREQATRQPGRLLPGFLNQGGAEREPRQGEGSLVPTALGENNRPLYTAEQIRQAGPVMGEVMEKSNENQAKIAQFEEERAKAKGQIAGQRTERQDAFSKKLKAHFPNVEGRDLELLERISRSPNLMSKGSDEERISDTRKIYDLYKRDEAALRKLNRPSFGDEAAVKDQDREVKAIAQRMIDMGERDLATQLVSGTGRGPVLTAQATNDLTPEQYKSAASLPSYKEHNTEIQRWGPMYARDAVPKNVQERLDKQQAALDDKWDQWLIDNIKPDVVDEDDPNINKPGTSLMLLRDQAMKKGMGFKAFGRKIRRLQESGKINLGVSQEADMPKVLQSPLETAGLYEALFRTLPGYYERD